MRILFLQKRLLFPVDTGWRIRTLNVVRHLARWHALTYVCNVRPEDEPHLETMRDLGMALDTVPWHETPRYSAGFYRDLAVNTLSRHPYTAVKDYHPGLRQKVAQRLASDSFDLVICDFVQMALNVLGLPMPASLLFQHNVEAQIFLRQAERGRGWWRRQYMRLQWRKMRAFEASAGRAFDLVVAVSDADKALFEESYGWTHVRTIDTSVDVDYFTPGRASTGGARAVFVGSLDWLPNEDGLEFFVRDVWPLVRAVRPEAELDIVGRNPSPAVRALAATPGVRLHASVPDVRPYVRDASVALVPLRIGGGTRLKVYEAMAMGKPIVSTTLGVEGLPVRDGEHLVVADRPRAFADAMLTLFDEASRRDALGSSARALVVERFSAETVARQFEACCLEAVARAGRARPR